MITVEENFRSIMIVSLTIVRYPKLLIPFALLAMALHRIPLSLNTKCSFWKLLGCGKNGTFDLSPDWQQWGLLTVWNNEQDCISFNKNSFIIKWWNFFTNEQFNILMKTLTSHGQWDGIEPFKHDITTDNNGQLAVLTRATIRLRKLKGFWSNVDPVAQLMRSAPGYITSIGVGEAPFFRQATFSVWQDLESMKAFAYGSKEHSEVIRKTRQNNWYSEELFARFKIISSSGTLNGINPLNN